MSPKSKPRVANLERNSKETEIKVELNVDGAGKTKIKTPLELLSHMLDLFAFHGYFDLTLDVKKADTAVDIHHTNEDIGIVLGKIFKKALGERQGIRRFGLACAPMESTLAQTVIDLSGRGYLTLTVDDTKKTVVQDHEGYAFTYLEHFLESFAHNLGATINIRISNPSEDLHTNLETVFKSLGLALDQATQIDPRRSNAVPSTKGIID